MSAVAGFDWDAGNREKCEKHGVSVAEIESLFSRAVAVHADAARSTAEDRFKAIGRTADGRHVFVVFAIRWKSGGTQRSYLGFADQTGQRAVRMATGRRLDGTMNAMEAAIEAATSSSATH